jgi:hypothetical protein
MRVSEERYTRDLRRYNLAVRLIRHEARTQTVCDWTGLSVDRVRTLYRSYPGGREVYRHRGPSPRRLDLMLETPAMRNECASITALCRLLGVLPEAPVHNARRTLPGVVTGERLCYAFEFYQSVIPHSRVTLEQLILLVTALAEGSEVSFAHCTACHGLILIERVDVRRRLCTFCARDSARRDASHSRPREGHEPASRDQHDVPAIEPEPAVEQRSLF